MNSSPPPVPPPTPPSLTQAQQRRHYFIGLGLGLIPLIIFLVSFGFSIGSTSLAFLYGVFLAALLYGIELIVTIRVLVNKRLRFAGYGLLTAFLASPVIAAVGYAVLPSLVRR